ncbi:MAG: response regulator transcription factor [Elusimicrobia bacterium]|nr:response regulator transcription factor [Elusimicrobiota bacterium]
MNVAIIGNDAKFCLILQELLESQNHRVTLIPDPGKAVSRILSDPMHLVVIDGVPSRETAQELIRSLRGHAQTQKLPVLVINPRAGSADVVDLLDAGADDFLLKPFHGQIFLARVRALLRRQIWGGGLKEEPVLTNLTCGPVEARLVERAVFVAGQPVALTRLEFDLLAYLLKNRDRVLPRQELLDSVWNYPQDVETRTLDKHVENLRRKLGEAGPSLQTVHGVGYRFLDPNSPLLPRTRAGK